MSEMRYCESCGMPLRFEYTDGCNSDFILLFFS